MDKELKNQCKCSCGEGKEIDEYLACTMCEPEEEIEDVTVPEDEEYELADEERPIRDPESEGYKEYL